MTSKIRIENYISIFLLIAVASIYIWVVSFLNKGFDLTDEGFYLNSISKPWLYHWSASRFGIIYNFFYKGLSSNLVLLRLFNLGLSLTLSLYCLSKISKYLKLEASEWGIQKTLRIFSLATISLLSLQLFGAWLPTPSYNSLCFQGILCSLGAVIEITFRGIKKTSLSPWLFLGLGGWLVFMAKPTSALLLGLSTCFYFVMIRKICIKKLGFSIATSLVLLLLSAILIDGGVMAFYENMKKASELAYILHNRSILNSFRIDPLRLEGKYLIRFVSTVAFLSLNFFLFLKLKKYQQTLEKGASVLTILFTFLVIFGGFNIIVFYPRNMGLLVLIVPLNIFCLALLGLRTRSESVEHRSRNIFFFIYTLTLSYSYVFGSGVNNWEGITASVFFAIVGTLSLISTLKLENVQPSYKFLVVSTLLLSINFLNAGFMRPYRHSSLKSNLVFSNFNQSLWVSPELAKYLADFEKQLKLMNFKDNSPIWDASGHSPGALYLMNARAIAQPWVIGGYSGSDIVAQEALTTVSCETLRRTWILYEPDGPRHLKFNENEILNLEKSKYKKSSPFQRVPYDGKRCLKGCTQYVLRPSSENTTHLRKCSDKI